MYRGDIEGNPGCDDATHFVYGYNLGAFALGSSNNLETKVGGSAFGFGAGGGTSEGRAAEKRGGDLGTCKSDSATEVMGCKTPIRLNLRPIRDGANPGIEAMTQTDTDASLSAAGTINQKLEMSEEAMAHYEAAVQKMNARDGKGCLAELDLHDDLDAKHKSTDPKSGQFAYRQGAASQGDGGQSTRTKPDLEFCETHWKKAKKLLPKVKPKNDDDHIMLNIEYGFHNSVPRCFARAGDCARAYETYKDTMPKVTKASIDEDGPEQAEKTYKHAFETDSSLKECRPK